MHTLTQAASLSSSAPLPPGGLHLEPNLPVSELQHVPSMTLLRIISRSGAQTQSVSITQSSLPANPLATPADFPFEMFQKMTASHHATATLTSPPPLAQATFFTITPSTTASHPEDGWAPF